MVAWAERPEATTLSKILESVRRRTITLKEEGESYEGLAGLSRTIPSAFLREGGWNPWARRGSRREGRREGLMRCFDSCNFFSFFFFFFKSYVHCLYGTRNDMHL